MRIMTLMKFLAVAVGIVVLSSAACAIVVTNYPIENTTGKAWWPCGWVSPSGDVWVFYQADRDSTGRNIVGRKITGTVPGPEVTVIDGVNSTNWQEPVIRGTAGYLVARHDANPTNRGLRVVDVNNSFSTVYELEAPKVFEPRIYDKTLVYQTDNSIWLVPDVTNPVEPIEIASGSGWMGHPDIEGDYVSYQWWDSSQNNTYLYQISTGITTQLTTSGENGCGNPHIGGGYVAFQNWGNSNKLYLYNIATGERTLMYTGGYFNDTVPGPALNDKYVIFTIDTSSNAADIMAYDIAAGTTFPVATFAYNDWGASIVGNRVFHGKYTGSMDAIYGALLTDTAPTGAVTGTVTLEDFVGDASLAPIRIELSKDGSVAYTKTVPAGSYTFDPVDVGTYDMSFSACRWQRKVVQVNVTPANTIQVDATLPNGDLNGSGTIDQDDFSVVNKNFGLANE